ncbi:MAG: Rne/Rng family ribonuclease [Clostridia bacterium]|nr:Rne/Rng family ribonuclease [Clostridia bacterium]
MKREMLLERVSSQTRLAILEDKRLCEIYYEREGRAKLAGNIYVGRVQNVLPGMNAAFVDIGMSKNAFLYAGDICIDTRGEDGLRDRLERARIEKIVRPGQMILVQVVKEPGGSKGPRVSGSVTLPGRLCVLLPTIEYAGVSKKIGDSAERERLYAAANRISKQFGAGIIVRTAAEGADEAQIRADFERLLRIWKRIQTEGSHSAKPRLIQNDGSIVIRALRDLMDESIEAVRTDDPEIYFELRDCAALFTPEYAERVELVKTETPLFDLLRVDAQLERAFDRHVYLKSGGTIVIDETEAMTVVDVNTGKFTGKKSLEETIFQINCEAADEIARQLRLRDIGGIVIIDFIDMETVENRDALIEHLRQALSNDRNRTNVLGMTALGLVEMTRKKVRRPLSKQLMRDCSACLAAGREWTHESIAYRIIRDIWRKRRAGDRLNYRILADKRVLDWICTIGIPENCVLEEGGRELNYEILPNS